jgi:hypothetical protein
MARTIAVRESSRSAYWLSVIAPIRLNDARVPDAYSISNAPPEPVAHRIAPIDGNQMHVEHIRSRIPPATAAWYYRQLALMWSPSPSPTLISPIAGPAQMNTRLRPPTLRTPNSTIFHPGWARAWLSASAGAASPSPGSATGCHRRPPPPECSTPQPLPGTTVCSSDRASSRRHRQRITPHTTRVPAPGRTNQYQ